MSLVERFEDTLSSDSNSRYLLRNTRVEYIMPIHHEPTMSTIIIESKEKSNNSRIGGIIGTSNGSKRTLVCVCVCVYKYHIECQASISVPSTPRARRARCLNTLFSCFLRKRSLTNRTCITEGRTELDLGLGCSVYDSKYMQPSFPQTQRRKELRNKVHGKP